MSADLDDAEMVALACLAVRRCGRSAARIEVRGHRWLPAPIETRARFAQFFPAMQDKPCTRSPERPRPPAHPIFTMNDSQNA